MRRFIATVTLLCSMLFLTGLLHSQDFRSENQGVKERQKQELKALKLKHKYQKRAMKNSTMSESLRKQMKHQMQREKKELRQKQKHELQELKDRQQALKAARAQY